MSETATELRPTTPRPLPVLGGPAYRRPRALPGAREVKITLRPEDIEQLDYLAGRDGISRGAVIRQLITATRPAATATET